MPAVAGGKRRHAAARTGRPGWRHTLRGIGLSLLVALTIEGLVLFAQKARWMPGLDDIGGDLFLGIYESLPGERYRDALKWLGMDEVLDRLGLWPTTGAPKPYPFVFLDIDDDAWKTWDHPARTPRDKLARLIGFAARNEAALVVVDVDLTDGDTAYGCDPLLAGRFASKPAPGEAALSPDSEVEAVLRMYTLPAAAGEGAPRIIHHKELELRREGGDEGGFLLRPSFLERCLPNAREPLPATVPKEASQAETDKPGGATSAGIHWASTLFEQSDDAVVRRWRLLALACGEPGRQEWVPSVQLLAWVLLDGKDRNLGELYNTLQAMISSDCGRQQDATKEQIGARSFEVFGKTVDLSPGALEKRVLYTIPWRQDERVSGAEVPRAGGRARMLTRLSAAQIVESEDRVWQRFRANPPKLGGKGEDEDSDWLEIRSALRDVAASDPELKIQNAELHKLIRGRIVIIGGSYTDARDTYRTPIGWMPGAIILANAIHSLRTFGPLRPPEFWTQKLPLIVFSVLLVGLSFHFLPVAVATLLALPAVLLVTFLLSTLWIQSGVWVDATAGCAAIVVHRFYEDGKHAIAWVLGKGVSTHGS